MDIFRVHRILDDPTIFNRGEGGGGEKAHKFLEHRLYNGKQGAAFLITSAPLGALAGASFFPSLPSIYFNHPSVSTNFGNLL